MATPADLTAGPVNSGTMLMPATQYVGTTTDDRVVAFTGTTTGAQTVPLAGGTPTTIDADSASLLVSRKTVFSWAGVSSNVTIGTLTVWTSALSAPRKASSKSFAGSAASTTDGTYIAYAENGVEHGATDIVVGKTDGSGSVTTVVTGADTANTECPIIIATTGTAFIIEYCTGSASMDMGNNVGKLVYVDPAAGTPAAVSISTDASDFSFDKAGDKLWYVDSTKKLFYTAVPPSGAATQVDTDIISAYITQDGSALLWTTTANALKRAATSALGTPTTIVAAGARNLRGISEDETMGFISDDEPNKDTSQSNLAYLSLTSANTPSKVVTDSSGVLYGPSFTSDSKIALWYDKNATSVANFHQTPIASGTATKIADAVWNHQTVTATKILFMDHYINASPTGKANLSRFDLTTSTTTLIVNGAQARNSIDLSSDKSKVIYDYQIKNNKTVSGVYTAPASQ
jgi:hypothetical protein